MTEEYQPKVKECARKSTSRSNAAILASTISSGVRMSARVARAPSPSTTSFRGQVCALIVLVEPLIPAHDAELGGRDNAYSWRPERHGPWRENGGSWERRRAALSENIATANRK